MKDSRSTASFLTTAEERSKGAGAIHAVCLSTRRPFNLGGTAAITGAHTLIANAKEAERSRRHRARRRLAEHWLCALRCRRFWSSTSRQSPWLLDATSAFLLGRIHHPRAAPWKKRVNLRRMELCWSIAITQPYWELCYKGRPQSEDTKRLRGLEEAEPYCSLWSFADAPHYAALHSFFCRCQCDVNGLLSYSL